MPAPYVRSSGACCSWFFSLGAHRSALLDIWEENKQFCHWLLQCSALASLWMHSFASEVNCSLSIVINKNIICEQARAYITYTGLHQHLLSSVWVLLSVNFLSTCNFLLPELETLQPINVSPFTICLSILCICVVFKQY